MQGTFQPYTWQTPHTKMLDKWQLGDITQDDLLEWAMWLDELQFDLPNLMPSEQTELIAVIFDEDDDFLLIKKVKNLLQTICEKSNLVKPKYDFAYPNYGLEITESFYQRLLPMITDDDLKIIAKLDHDIDTESHYLALKDTIYKQNGKINYETQKTWFPHEVLSLGHWSCESKAFEVAYAVCNCILARNILMHNNIFDDFRDYEIERMSSNNLTEIINYHIHYASRLNLLEHSSYRNWAFNNS